MSPSKRKPNRTTTAREAAAPYGKQKPVYFLSLDVENVRCFGKKQTLKLTEKDGSPAQWTIIIGNNGTGKTTLLQCLVAMEPRIGLDKDSSTAIGHTKFPRWLSSLNRTSKLMIEISAMYGRSCTLSSNPESKSTEFEIYQVEFEKRPTKTGTFDLPPSLLNRRCYAYGAARRPGPPSLSEPSEESNCASLFNEETDLINPQEWMVQADYRALKGVSLATIQFGQVKDALVSLLPDVADIRVPRPSDLQDTPRAEFKTPYGWVGFNQLGFGYRSMITWVVDFAVRLFRRYPDSPNPLTEPAVCLVDEIDLHMHPKWQREMIQYLSKHFPNTQFIATAHSPLVIQAAEDANIVLLRKEGDEVVIENDMNIVKGWRVDQILTSDLFGLPSARPPKYDDVYTKRVELAMKPKLTSAEQKELKRLDRKMDSLPFGETQMEREARAIILATVEELKRRGNGGDSSRKAGRTAKTPAGKGKAKAR